MEYACSEERFLNDVKDHKLTIIKDDGLYRHIRLSREGSSVYRYDLITWPGYLCTTGDMGCWTFSRIEDMFEFFIMTDTDFNKPHVINPGYWEEKIRSVSKFGGPATKFNIDTFKESVLQRVEDYFDDEDAAKEKAECIAELENDVFSYMEDEHEQSIYQKLQEFRFGDFSFDEMPHAEEYTLHYIWILYAIVYGINAYTKVKEKLHE
jgi:hypothetical protein